MPPARPVKHEKLLAAAGAIEAGDLAGARRLLEKILKRDRNHAIALKLAGVVAYQGGQLARAIELLRRAAAGTPLDAGVWVNLGAACNAAGRYADADKAARKALELAPEDPIALSNLGKNALDQRQPRRAREILEQALRRDPASALARHNLGVCLRELGDPAAAVAMLETVCERAEGRAELCGARRECRDLAGATEDAARLFADPGAGDLVVGAWECFFDACDWDAIARTRERVLQLLAAPATRATCRESGLMQLHSLSGLDPSDQRQLHEAWAAPLVRPGRRPPEPPPAPPGRLRIGYLSPDFRDHSVGLFIAPVVAAHDRGSVEVSCYSSTREPDATTARIEAAADHFVDCADLDDDQLGARIKADGIDVLVDLAGHTRGNRVAAMAQRLAPVQATWLGYPGTTGLATVDYRISDPLVDPEPAPQFTERLLRLPRSFLCFGAFEDVPRTVEAPAARRGEVTFGSFNNFRKLQPETLRCWAEILRAVPRSRLVLKAPQADREPARSNVLEAFAAAGVDPQRIVLSGVTAARTAHLDAYNSVDLALDTWPYNGTTTTCEALWMGVPVLTVRGALHAARVSASILENCGLDQLITTTPDQYTARAIELGRDLPRLAGLRRAAAAGVRESILCRPDAFVRDLEAAYRSCFAGIARQACA